MRQILVDEARRRYSLKRGVGRPRATLSAITVADETPLEDLLDLDDALCKLERLDSRKAQIVTLRFFAGLTVEQTASALDISPATVKNDWSFAKAWLHREIDAPVESGEHL
jgi:RNA polymerase sigma factor (TIGR02999 family)